MTLPLYSASIGNARTGAASSQMPDGAHPGLWFERFFSAWNNNYTEIDKTERSQWLHGFSTAGEQAALEQHANRMTELAQSRSGATRIYLCSGNFVSGIGNAHPLENGFTWHPTLGVPYLSGAAVKGLARAAVETAYTGEDKAAILTRWFGSEDKKPEHVSENAGQFIFLDALPTMPCKLHAEIMTPHMGKWYEQGGKNPGNADTMPGDWHSPNPVSYLVARGVSLLVAIIPRTPDAAAELGNVWSALDYALQHLGAGAKTAIGFGVMQTEEQRQRRIEEERLRQQQRQEEDRLRQQQRQEQEKAEAARQVEANAETWEGALFKFNRKNGSFSAEKDGQTAAAFGDDGKQCFASLPPEMQRTLQGGRPVRGTARIVRQDKEIKLLGVSASSA